MAKTGIVENGPLYTGLVNARTRLPVMLRIKTLYQHKENIPRRKKQKKLEKLKVCDKSYNRDNMTWRYKRFNVNN